MNKEIMKGSIDILLLSQIARRDMYGFEIVKELQLKSNNIYKMSEGTLYPALQRLEQKMCVCSYWENSDAGGRRKYYKITDLGMEKLIKKMDEWKQVSELIHSCKEELNWIDLENTSMQF
ncbi:MAG: PadR family transcriptional regulator [Velocimicrobium sp.]